MNKASFSINKTKFVAELKKMAKPFGRSKWNQGMVLEITITDNKITLVIPGMRVELPAKTSHTVKATLGFFYFLDIISNLKEKDTQVTITDSTLSVEGLHVTVQTTFFENDSILRSIKLPINYTDFHLLRMDQMGFTIEEIRFNKLEFEIFYAKKALRANINKAHSILKVYGIRKSEVEEMVWGKVQVDSN